MKIGVDLMGSDHSPHVLFEAVLQAKNALQEGCTLLVIATHSVVNELKLRHPPDSCIEYRAVSEAIAMSDDPVPAVTRKPESSIVVGIRLLKKKKIDAFVSAGNTGALLASALLHLPRLPGIQRPALLAMMPSIHGSMAVLDIGGNVSCKAHHLVQFAQMGAIFQTCYQGIEAPKVGLLNVGVEPKKGTSVMRQAYQILSENKQINFIGNIEGREVFQKPIDVVVTDGVTGNVMLKTSEGIAAFIFDYLQNELQEAPSEQLKRAIKNAKGFFSTSEFSGAILCGVEGLVIKCHGNVSAKRMATAIVETTHLVKNELIAKMKSELMKL